MKTRLLLILMLPLLMFSTAQAAYITDKLVAGLYKEAKVSDKPLKALPSNTPVEVISRKNGFIKVKTADGTVGWIEADYVTDEKPSSIMLLSAQAKIASLQKQVKTLKKQKGDASKADKKTDNSKQIQELEDRLAKAQGQISQMQIQLKAAKAGQADQQVLEQQLQQEKQILKQKLTTEHANQLKQLKTQNQALQQRINKVADLLGVEAASNEVAPVSATQNSYWLYAIPFVALLLGVVLGILYINYRISKKYGGLRL